MDAKLFDDMVTAIVTSGKHLDGSSFIGGHSEHYRYGDAIYIIDYNKANEPFAIISTMSNHTFRHPTRNSKEQQS